MDYSANLEKKNQKQKKKEKTNQRIIIDDIENIFISLIGKFSFKLLLQTWIVLAISFGVNVCHWLYLFLMKEKLENNYCLTKLNQFDNCLASDFCDRSTFFLLIIPFSYNLQIYSKFTQSRNLRLQGSFFLSIT